MAAAVPTAGWSGALELEGAPAAVTCARYADRVFLAVTQGGSFGTLVAASTAQHPDGALEPHVRVLLGDREDDYVQLAATRLQEAVFRDAQLPLLLALGLKGPLSEDRARALLAYLEAERPWAAPAARVLGPAPAPSSS